MPFSQPFISHTRWALKFESVTVTTCNSLVKLVWNFVVTFIGFIVLMCLLLTVILRDVLKLKFKIQYYFFFFLLVMLFMNSTSRTFRADLNNNNQSLVKAKFNCILTYRHIFIFSFIKCCDVLIFISTYLYMLL